jgi:hypothetical protein
MIKDQKQQRKLKMNPQEVKVNKGFEMPHSSLGLFPSLE